VPRPAPLPIELLPCLRWPTPGAWWAEPWTASERSDSLEKYRAMSEALTSSPIDPARLRAIASRWPGALREAQLTPPDIYRERAIALQADKARAPAAALWAELHRLTADVARMRSGSFDALDPDRRACWPTEPDRWPGWVLEHRGPRLALAWLAALAGLAPAELDAALRR
jgi:hypothetical protein